MRRVTSIPDRSRKLRTLLPMAILFALLLGFPLLFATKGSELVWCPVCGQESSISHLRLYGISFESDASWREPCALPPHRPLATSRARTTWWQTGRRHATLRADSYRYRRDKFLAPYLDSPGLDDGARRLVLDALRSADLEKLDRLLGPASVLEEKDVLPWARGAGR